MPNSHKLPWWRTNVNYQIYLRSFKDANGDGIGDLQGLLEKIDYLATLGIQALWLTPFYPSPMKDFGYDVADFKMVDPLFGDLSTLEQLVKKAHHNGLKLITDLILNHTSEAHPWFVDSRKDRKNPKRDWYIWADPKADGTPPNNWLSVFGGSAWEWDQPSGQYYLHTFLKEQPDLNWRNPEVKEAMLEVMRFWIDLGVDGFRLGCAHHLLKDPQLQDNPPAKPSHPRKDIGPYDMQQHLHDKGHPDLHPLFRELRHFLDNYRPEFPRLGFGELHGCSWEEWVSYYGQNDDELHMPINFNLMNTPWKATAVREVVERVESILPDWAWPNYALGSHDDPRLVTRVGEAQGRIAAVLLLTLRGTPTIYYGEEIGMTDMEIPHEREQDTWGLRMPGLGRDGARTPMQWSPRGNANFSPADPEKYWLPVNPNHHEVNVASQLIRTESMLTLYRRLLFLRANTKALQVGSYQGLDFAPDDCYFYLRAHRSERFLVALNFADQVRECPLPEQFNQGLILVSTHEREEKNLAGNLVLEKNEGLVVKLQ
ncbi:MAG: DUF3459 domain-containing protein [Calditrichaeota bacterium]|nr:DUF3459 domain-containing protein [Calditrichota bacterium]HQU71442.1 alpha-amylase family glycosyl hydrolase [Calditrichia bacterium]